MYTLIANDNLLMEKCDEPGAAILERYYPIVKGEALALRAMMHFDLMRFYGPKGGVGDWPAIFAGTGTTGWIECSRVYEIPEGATSLAFEPANFGSSGKVEFKKLTLELDEMK